MSKLDNDFMYNWIREKSGRSVTTQNSGSKDNNNEYCNIHNIKLNEDKQCSMCNEKNNK
jgi:hypothetical protein